MKKDYEKNGSGREITRHIKAARSGKNLSEEEGCAVHRYYDHRCQWCKKKLQEVKLKK